MSVWCRNFWQDAHRWLDQAEESKSTAHGCEKDLAGTSKMVAKIAARTLEPKT
jgi:hypothetical protein